MPPKKLTKAQQLARQRALLGRCSDLTQKGTECTRWAVDRVNDVAYCGQHIAARALALDVERRAAAKREALDARIEKTLEWHRAHPSVWDTMPREA